MNESFFGEGLTLVTKRLGCSLALTIRLCYTLPPRMSTHYYNTIYLHYLKTRAVPQH